MKTEEELNILKEITQGFNWNCNCLKCRKIKKKINEILENENTKTNKQTERNYK